MEGAGGVWAQEARPREGVGPEAGAGQEGRGRGPGDPRWGRRCVGEGSEPRRWRGGDLGGRVGFAEALGPAAGLASARAGEGRTPLNGSLLLLQR